MKRQSRKYQYWTEDELYFIYASYLSKKSTSSIAKKLGRTTTGTHTAISRLKRLVNENKLSKGDTCSALFFNVAKKIRQEIKELGKPELSVENFNKKTDIESNGEKSSLDIAVDQFSDYIDDFKLNLSRYAVKIIEESIKEFQLKMIEREKELVSRAEKAEQEIETLKPLVEVAKKENTRSMLEKMLNSFRSSS